MLSLTESNFEKEVVQSDKTVIVDFWAPWCGPCKIVAPTFEALAEEMPSVKFAKVNVDEAGGLARQFGVQSIPTFIVFKGGKEVNRGVGALDKARLKALIG